MDFKKQHRGYTYVIFGQRAEECDNVKATSHLAEVRSALGDVLDYHIFQLERCPTTGRLHLQGFLKLVGNGLRYTPFKKLADQCPALVSVAWKAMRKEDACIRYHQKPLTHVAGPWSEGPVPTPSSSKKSNQPPPPRPLSEQKKWVVLCHGPHGVGKSYAWRAWCRERGLTIGEISGKAQNSSARWLSGWQGEDVALIDEVEFSDFSLKQWLSILDDFDHPLPCAMGGGYEGYYYVDPKDSHSHNQSFPF